MAWVEPGSVLVVGSLHLDVIVDAPALPRLDETLMGKSVGYAFGGKGGNQALAAARFGAQVAMAGRIGSDAFGDQLRGVLQASDVDDCQVLSDPGASGMSVAIVDDKGAYGAVVVSGANQHILADDITIPEGTRLLLLQNEVPGIVNLAIAEKARAKGCKIIWNAAPARQDTSLLQFVDLLIVNRVEALDMTGREDPAEQAQDLADRLDGPVIVTLGAEGLILANPVPVVHAARPVHVLSSHGAGDAFTGALASRLADGAELTAAVEFAQAAAALHVSTPVENRGNLTSQDVIESMG